jgi:signal transduction histidine kinase/CheY-like chemotaxis protein
MSFIHFMKIESERIMKTQSHTIQPVRIYYILYGLIFAACYWAMEAVRDVITFERGTFLERFLFPDSSAFWMRILVVCVILLFGAVTDIIRARRFSVRWRGWIEGEWGFFLLACLFGVWYWFFEAFRDSYIYGSGSFFGAAFSPHPVFLWMRLMVICFLALFGLFTQVQINDVRKKGSALSLKNENLEDVIRLKSMELGKAEALIGKLQEEIQKRKWLEEENVKIQDHLIQSQKVEAIGVVAGGIAHDFNNLLTAVLGVSTLALKETKPENPLYSDLQQIHNAARRAADLTRQLLLFSREHPMKFSALNLNSIIQGLRAMLHSLIAEDISLDFRLDPSILPVFGDKGTVEQVILNLVVNGRDALPKGGHITVQTENVTFDGYPGSRPGDHASGPYVCLKISDDGIGMPEEVKTKIFEPFFSTKSPGTGTGLGLTVVNRIIQKHDGWIDIKSNPGRGSVFSVFLPAVVSRVVKTDEYGNSTACLRADGKRILLVEDDKPVREFVLRALLQQGYSVLTAQCAVEAKTLFYRDHGKFDLILSDVVLPDGNGVDMILDMRKNCPEVPVLFCSGHADSKSQWPRIQKFGFHLLKKPYELHDLLKGIEENLS